jgi:hypothetical protein
MLNKIAIILDVNYYSWNGGINYFNSLAENLEEAKNKLIIITGKKTSIDQKKFNSKIQFIRTRYCDPKTLPWFFRKIIFSLINRDILLLHFLSKNNINTVSHSVILGNQKKIKVITWVPDMQQFVLKSNFNKIESKKKIKQYSKYIKYSNKILFSSHTEKNKFRKFFRINKNINTSVIHNLPSLIKKNKIVSLKDLKVKFNFKKKFFYIPNQFWEHKNHMFMLKVIKNLKNINCIFIFSGELNDYRNENYIQKILLFIKKNKLNNKIKILGNIKYNEVICLMIWSIGVINPSLYEGWSTSVEEAKIYKKRLIISNIDVHKEQINNQTNFFDINNPKNLSDKIRLITKLPIKKFNYFNISESYLIKQKKFKNELSKLYSKEE